VWPRGSSLPMALDPYAVLEVPRNATQDQITAAYRRKALEWHPDRNPHRKATAEARFKEVGAAYCILGDPERRAEHDRSTGGFGGGMPGGRGGAPMPNFTGAMPQGFESPEAIFRRVFGRADCPAPPFLFRPGALLVAALLIDFIGIISFLIPGIGDMTDMMWAPASAYLIKQLFDDSLFATLGLLEEMLPLTDFIPTATLCWARRKCII